MSFIGQVNSSGLEQYGTSEFAWLLIDKVFILSGLIFSQKVKNQMAKQKASNARRVDCLCRDVACNLSYVRRSSETITPDSVMA
jgi:hypothetical protein